MKKWLDALSIFIWFFFLWTLVVVAIQFFNQREIDTAQKFRGEFYRYNVEILEYISTTGDTDTDDTADIYFEVNNKRKRINVKFEAIRYHDKIGDLIDVWCYSGLVQCFIAEEGEQRVNFPKEFTKVNKNEVYFFRSLAVILSILLILQYRL